MFCSQNCTIACDLLMTVNVAGSISSWCPWTFLAASRIFSALRVEFLIIWLANKRHITNYCENCSVPSNSHFACDDAIRTLESVMKAVAIAFHHWSKTSKLKKKSVAGKLSIKPFDISAGENWGHVEENVFWQCGYGQTCLTFWQAISEHLKYNKLTVVLDNSIHIYVSKIIVE